MNCIVAASKLMGPYKDSCKGIKTYFRTTSKLYGIKGRLVIDGSVLLYVFLNSFQQGFLELHQLLRTELTYICQEFILFDDNMKHCYLKYIIVYDGLPRALQAASRARSLRCAKNVEALTAALGDKDFDPIQ